MHGEEIKYIADAIDSNWVSTEGANLTDLEKQVCERVGCGYAVPLASGTAALHLAVRLAGVKEGDVVFCSDITFYASVNAIVYENGTDPSMPDITKYIFKPVAEINPAGTDILTNTDWYSATGTAFCPPTPNINTCCGIKASTTNTTQPDIWNVTFPLQGQK